MVNTGVEVDTHMLPTELWLLFRSGAQSFSKHSSLQIKCGSSGLLWEQCLWCCAFASCAFLFPPFKAGLWCLYGYIICVSSILVVFIWLLSYYLCFLHLKLMLMWGRQHVYLSMTKNTALCGSSGLLCESCVCGAVRLLHVHLCLLH